jgi:hypothetical protein
VGRDLMARCGSSTPRNRSPSAGVLANRDADLEPRDMVPAMRGRAQTHTSSCWPQVVRPGPCKPPCLPPTTADTKLEDRSTRPGCTQASSAGPIRRVLAVREREPTGVRDRGFCAPPHPRLLVIEPRTKTRALARDGIGGSSFALAGVRLSVSIPREARRGCQSPFPSCRPGHDSSRMPWPRAPSRRGFRQPHDRGGSDLRIAGCD